MEAERFQAWVERYRAVWESNDPAEVGALFTDDAHYITNGNVYDNLWEIVLDAEDRCSRFTEWWMLRR